MPSTHASLLYKQWWTETPNLVTNCVYITAHVQLARRSKSQLSVDVYPVQLSINSVTRHLELPLHEAIGIEADAWYREPKGDVALMGVLLLLTGS